MSRRARKQRSEMNGNSLGVVLSPGGLAAAERSGGSPPGEPQRSGAAAKAGADPVPASRPDPEVVAKPKRRTYTVEYKQRILQEAEVAATTRAGLGALLRREGLVLVSADLLAARAGPGNPRGSDPTETRAEVQGQPDGRRNPETSPTNRPLDRKSA